MPLITFIECYFVLLCVVHSPLYFLNHILLEGTDFLLFVVRRDLGDNFSVICHLIGFDRLLFDSQLMGTRSSRAQLK